MKQHIMERFFSVSVALVLCLGCAACSRQETPSSSDYATSSPMSVGGESASTIDSTTTTSEGEKDMSTTSTKKEPTSSGSNPVGSVTTTTTTTTTTTKAPSTDAKVAESPLSNAYKLLTTEKKLTLGYLGGSITLGTSAVKEGGSIEKSYVNLYSSWFKQQFPNATIETVNAGISDTGTNFGLFRLERTLMNTNGHDMPDVVFVEFTNNDWTYATQSQADLERQIESLFLNIYRLNPYAEIVAVITARSETTNRAAYKVVCDHYGIPMIDAGIEMQKLVNARGPETAGSYYYTIDNLHPTWRGYAAYFDAAKPVFEKNVKNLKLQSKALYRYGAHLPKARSTNLILSPRVLSVDEFTYAGTFKKVSSPLYYWMYGTSMTEQYTALADSYISANGNAKIEATFSGSALGIFFRMSNAGINMRYSIDGGEWKYLKVDDKEFSWQRYDHPQVFMLAHDLSAGKHTVQMIFQNANGADAIGVTVAGLLVNG